jgi:isopentenyldiphosphate isomerase
MKNKIYYITIDNRTMDDYLVKLKSYTKGNKFDEIEKFKYVSKNDLQSTVDSFSKGKTIKHLLNYTTEDIKQ